MSSAQQTYQQLTDEIDRLQARINQLESLVAVADSDHSTASATQSDSDHLGTLLENAFEGIAIVEADARIQRVGPSVSEILGYESDEIVGRIAFEFVHPDDVPAAAAALKGLLEQPTVPVSAAYRFLHKDGSVRYIEARTVNLLDDQRIRGLVAHFRDVTDAKHAEAQLKESEQRFKALIHTAPEAITVLDLEENRFVEVNDHTVKLTGYPREDLLRMNPEHVSPPTQPDGRTFQEAFFQEVAPRVMAGEQVTIEWVCRRADGSDFPAEIRIVDFPTAKGRQIRSSFFDITERKRAEQALKQTRFAVDSAADAMFTIDREGRFVDVNRTACRRLGYTRDELLTMTVSDINPHYPLEAWPAHWEQLKRAGQSVYESEHRTKTGQVFPVEISKSFFEFERNQYAFAFVRDITERKLAQEERQRLVSLVENSCDFIGLAEMSGRVTYVNQAGLDLVGLDSLEEARKTTNMDYVPPEDIPWLVNSTLPALQEQGYWIGEHRFRHFRSGEHIPVDINSFVITDLDNRQPIGIGIVARDISERRRQELKLREHQQALSHVSRLSTMGEMVAGVAHEINQPLFAICNFAQACSSALQEREDPAAIQLKKWVRLINDQAVSCGDIIRRLRDFVTKNEADRQLFNVNDVIRESVALVAVDVRENPIPIELDLVAPDPHLHAVRVQLQQVFVNLLRNACEALGSSKGSYGRIVVRSFVSGRRFHTTFEDNGPGIAEEHRERLFETFFTTKPEGMGMGLAISQSIVNDHQGRLWAESTKPRGATFHVELPIAQQAPDSEQLV